MSKRNYDISKYTDNQLFSILNLINPTDHELEAQINLYLQKYQENDEMFDFFTDVYHHFFLLDVDEEEYDELYDEENEQE